MRVIALITALGILIATGAEAQTFQLICTNAEDTPSRLEVNFDRSTVQVFRGDEGGVWSEAATPAKFGPAAILWDDPMDGTENSIERSTGMLKKWVSGVTIFTKECRRSP